MKIKILCGRQDRAASHGQINNRSVTVSACYRIFRRLAGCARSAAAACAHGACVARRLCDVHRTGRVPRAQRRVPRRLRLPHSLDTVLTHTVIRRQESAPQDIRRSPAPASARPQAGAQVTHQRELLAHQQPRPRVPLARALPATPTWKVYARRILLGHGYTGQ